MAGLALLLVLSLAACGGKAEPRSAAQSAPPSPGAPATGGKRVVAAIQGDPVSVIYAVQNGVASQTPGVDAIELLVAAGATQLDNHGVLVPQLAEQVPTIENGLWRIFPDGRMDTTWHLREDTRWQDGTPLTADDFRFTTVVGRTPGLGLLGNVGYGAFDTIDTPDPRTVTVHWKQPFIGADQMFTSVGQFALPLPRHLLESSYLANPVGLSDLPYWTTDYVGAGPYRVHEWLRGSHLTLDAFDGYVAGRPHLDQIEVQFILDQNTLVAAILAGTVSLTIGKTISLEQALLLRNQWTGGRIELSLASWLVTYPQFLGPSPPVVGEVAFRRALQYGTDRQALVDELMGGATSVADTFVNPAEPEYPEVAPAIQHYAYDPRQAAQLLEGLGYQRGADGMYRDAGGVPLQVELRTDGGNDLFRKTLLAVANDWQRLGVAVDALLVPPQRSRDREFQATFPGFSLTRNPSDLHSLTGYQGVNAPVPENEFRSPGGVNRSRYMSPDFDALIDRYLATVPRAERMALARQVIGAMTEQLLAMGLFYDVEPTAIASELRNVTARAKGSAQTWNAASWEL
jgi:peptide/nickel transport system substrate-binding protein